MSTTYECQDHKCPKCGKTFSHIIYFGFDCADLKKRLRACPECVEDDRRRIEAPLFRLPR